MILPILSELLGRKEGDAGGVAQAGSNSEIHEVHR